MFNTGQQFNKKNCSLAIADGDKQFKKTNKQNDLFALFQIQIFTKDERSNGYDGEKKIGKRTKIQTSYKTVSKITQTLISH